jgi:hypothetical protein
MPAVSIEKCRDSKTLPERLSEDLNEITEEVRRRAF